MRILPIRNPITVARNRISEIFTLPDRFKGTVVEKWANYWRGLVRDYGEVAVGVVKDAKSNPKKALWISGLGYGLYECIQRNPDEEAFIRQLRSYDNKMILVATSMHNPKSSRYLLEMETALNHQKLRTLSLGILTLLWMDMYDKDECTYAVEEEYEKVSYKNFHQHVIDVGFLGRFWRLEWEMINYDINYA